MELTVVSCSVSINDTSFSHPEFSSGSQTTEFPHDGLVARDPRPKAGASFNQVQNDSSSC